MVKCQFIPDQKFRQGSLYKLTEWNDLNLYQRELLSGLQEESEVYGLFEPVPGIAGLTYKVAYREVAMLFLHLQHFERLPHYFIVSATSHAGETVARLVLDDIIQMEWKNGYVSGPAAVPAIFGENIFEENHLPSFLSELSFKGIHYAWLQGEPEVKAVASMLYSYNTVPWDASMKAAFYQKHTAKEFIFSRTGITANEIIDAQWQGNKNDEQRYWLSWHRSAHHNKSSASTYSCKLYISPKIDDLPEVFARFIPVITDSAAFSFKVGNSIEGLLRPDKMVAYFPSKESLLKTVSLLEKEINGFPAQGVPFTLQLDGKGLLSFGEDPPTSEVLGKIEGGSWRSFITDQLAMILIQSKLNKLTWEESVGFIRARLLTAGIDIHSWSGMLRPVI